MPILSGVSGNALASLSSIDKWVTTVNSSISGAAKTGFKANKVTFGGGTPQLDKPALGGELAIQFAEQSLSIASTTIDFTEGQVVASTEFSHLAINGDQKDFFTLCDKPTTAEGTFTAGTQFFLTRDGEFHVNANGQLVNKDGLYVVYMTQNNRASTDSLGTTTENFEKIVNDMIERFNNPPTTITGPSFAINNVTNLQGLKFSKYGATVFDVIDNQAAYAALHTPAASTTFLARSSSANASTKISGNSLEASNVQLPSSLVELSLAQKLYSALTKVIQIDQQKIDSILNLIR